MDASPAADPFDDEPEEGVLDADDEDPADASLGEEEDDDEGDLVDGDLASDEDLDDASDDEDEEETVATALVTPDAAFDDDDDDLVAVVGGDDEDDDEEIEGLRDGEFVCRSCHLAMRDTQLADARNMICRDCV